MIRARLVDITLQPPWNAPGTAAAYMRQPGCLPGRTGKTTGCGSNRRGMSGFVDETLPVNSFWCRSINREMRYRI